MGDVALYPVAGDDRGIRPDPAAGLGGFYYLVSQQGLLVSLFYPLLAALIGYTIFETYEIFVSERKSRYLRRAFSSYVSPDLVSRLIYQPESLTLTGEEREISVLFSDIRGFTTLSEAMTPTQLVSLLNRFLGPMTEILMQEQGTLDKYIGDAIMAIYNAPLDVPEHALHAARTAQSMQQALRRLNPEFAREFGVELRIGVGLNTGAAVVGNMGSARRFNYTAMGDTVNLASRLEGRTKYYGVEIIAAQATRELLGEALPLRRLDRIRVKGKTQPVEIFQLFVDGEVAEHQGLIDAFESAQAHYFAGEFAAALEAFEALRERYPEDRPTEIFIERSRYHLEHPPEGQWDGVFNSLEK